MTYITDLALKNVVASSTSHTNVQNAGQYGHNDGVTGSIVTYTPTASATKIIYEISFYLLMDNSYYNNYKMGFINCINVQQSTDGGTSWNNVDDDLIRQEGFVIQLGNSYQVERRHVHCTFIVPAWTGTRMLRTGFYTGVSWGMDSRLHKMDRWDGTTQTKYCNTSVLVHEV